MITFSRCRYAKQVMVQKLKKCYFDMLYSLKTHVDNQVDETQSIHFVIHFRWYLRIVMHAQ